MASVEPAPIEVRTVEPEPAPAPAVPEEIPVAIRALVADIERAEAEGDRLESAELPERGWVSAYAPARLERGEPLIPSDAQQARLFAHRLPLLSVVAEQAEGEVRVVYEHRGIVVMLWLPESAMLEVAADRITLRAAEDAPEPPPDGSVALHPGLAVRMVQASGALVSIAYGDPTTQVQLRGWVPRSSIRRTFTPAARALRPEGRLAYVRDGVEVRDRPRGSTVVARLVNGPECGVSGAHEVIVTGAARSGYSPIAISRAWEGDGDLAELYRERGDYEIRGWVASRDLTEEGPMMDLSLHGAGVGFAAGHALLGSLPERALLYVAPGEEIVGFARDGVAIAADDHPAGGFWVFQVSPFGTMRFWTPTLDEVASTSSE